jgi:hypothetical protein
MKHVRILEYSACTKYEGDQEEVGEEDGCLELRPQIRPTFADCSGQIRQAFNQEQELIGEDARDRKSDVHHQDLFGNVRCR